MTPRPDFMECDTCRALPGSPPLCRGCLHNREVIAALKVAASIRFWVRPVGWSWRGALFKFFWRRGQWPHISRTAANDDRMDMVT